MKVLLVLNPIAGGADHADTIAAVKAMAEEAGYEVASYMTTGDNDDRKIRRTIDKFKPHRVIIGGGDGSIQMVARNLIGHEAALGILPMGSANGLATALGVPQDPLKALNKILTSTEMKTIDMLKINDSHFSIHLADIGTNALLIKKYTESGIRGMMGYAKHLIASVKESEMMRIIIRTYDSIITREGIMMAFANAHKYGTGVQISEGSVSDGKFEICNVEKFALDDAIKAGLTALNVFVDKNMFSDVITCSEAEIEISRKTHFQIDGEYMGMVDHLKIEVIPSCIKLLI